MKRWLVKLNYTMSLIQDTAPQGVDISPIKDVAIKISAITPYEASDVARFVYYAITSGKWKIGELLKEPDLIEKVFKPLGELAAMGLGIDIDDIIKILR